MTDIYVATTGSDTTGNGSSGNPYRTILKASQIAQPGDVVRVQPGTYSGGFHTEANGTSGSPITYRSEVKWGAKIVPPPSSVTDSAWDQDGDWIVVDGFEIDGTNHVVGTKWRFGVYCRGSNVVVQNCHVHHIANSITPGDGAAGLYGEGFFDDRNISFIANKVHHVGLPAGDNTMHGIYSANQFGTVANNLIYQNAGWGYTTYHSGNGQVVANNTLFANKSGGIAISWDSGSEYPPFVGPGGNFVLNNNICFDSPYGIFVQDTIGSMASIANNCCFNNPSGDFAVAVGTPTGSIVANPLFVNYVDDGSGDYHLQSVSPCVNAGTLSDAPATDFDGNARPQGVAIDVGAFETIASQEIYVATTGNDTTGTGASGNPYATIAQALSIATPGATIHVAPGDYLGGFSTTASGQPGAPITIVSDTLWGARIVNGPTGTPANGYTFWEQIGDYVIVDGFEIVGDDSNTSEDWRIGLYNMGSHCLVRRCKVHNLIRNTTAYAAAFAGSGAVGIMLDGWDGDVDMQAIGNVVFNIGPDSEGEAHFYGILHTIDGVIANNVVYNTVGAGVRVSNSAANVAIVNNTIDNARNAGIHLAGESGPIIDNIDVHNNIIRNCAPFAVAETGTTGLANTYVSNLLFANADGFWLQNGATATGTITADPLHVNRDAHDYHLLAGSPAINAGAAMLAPGTDFDGLPRVSPDIGAFEFIESLAIDVHYQESVGESTTTVAASWTNKTTLAFDPKPNSAYLLIWSALIGGTARCNVRLRDQSGAVDLSAQSETAIGWSPSHTPAGGIARVTFGATPGTRAFSIDFQSSAAGTQVAIKDARILAIEMGPDDEWIAVDGETTHNTPFSFDEVASLEFTPPSAGDYLLIFSAECGNTDTVGTGHSLLSASLDGGQLHEGVNVVPGNVSARVFWGIGAVATLSAAAHDLTIRCGSDFTDATIRRARIAALRLDRFSAYQSASNQTQASSATQGAWVDFASLAYTPDVASRDHVILAFQGGKSANASDAMGGRIDDGGTIRHQWGRESSHGDRHFHWFAAWLLDSLPATPRTIKTQFAELEFSTAFADDALIVGLQLPIEQSGEEHVWIASGGLVTGGTAAVAFENVAPSPAGGIAFSGAAQISTESASDFPFIASGGLTASGAAEVSFVASIAPFGGIVFSGAAEVTLAIPQEYQHDAAGGIEFDGGISLEVEFHYVPESGPIDIDGGEVHEINLIHEHAPPWRSGFVPPEKRKASFLAESRFRSFPPENRRNGFAAERRREVIAPESRKAVLQEDR